MKNAFVVAVLLFAYAAAQEEECPMIAALKGGMKKCVESMNPTEETLKNFREDEGIDDQPTNCFRSCMLKEAELMNDAKVDLDKLEEILKSSEKFDPATVDAIMGGMKQCREQAETSDDECLVAGSYAKCFKDFKDAAKAKSAE